MNVHFMSSLIAELWAIRKGLKPAWQIGFTLSLM